MGTVVKFKEGTEAQILALTPQSENWIDRAFYYPTDKSYFYRITNGVMKRYGDGSNTDTTPVFGIKLNNDYLTGCINTVQNGDTLTIPDEFEHHSFSMKVEGVINLQGQMMIL